MRFENIIFWNFLSNHRWVYRKNNSPRYLLFKSILDKFPKNISRILILPKYISLQKNNSPGNLRFYQFFRVPGFLYFRWAPLKYFSHLALLTNLYEFRQIFPKTYFSKLYEFTGNISRGLTFSISCEFPASYILEEFP